MSALSPRLTRFKDTLSRVKSAKSSDNAASDVEPSALGAMFRIAELTCRLAAADKADAADTNGIESPRKRPDQFKFHYSTMVRVLVDLCADADLAVCNRCLWPALARESSVLLSSK